MDAARFCILFFIWSALYALVVFLVALLRETVEAGFGILLQMGEEILRAGRGT
jgi:hypothetical protein